MRVYFHAIACLLILASPVFADDPPAPVPVTEAAGKMTLPEGFAATLFAGEPDCVQPIAGTFDARGRLWVVECMSYPKWTPEPPGNDRVSIYEDRDGDGQFDEKTIFWDRGHNLSGIEVGFGGVWLCSTPNLVYVPDTDGDDVPDGPPQVVLDGWDLKARHNVFNALVWGPDGWLWGCNGILSNSLIGPVGATPEQRTSINCGVWRYHPMRKKFEAVAHGTTNPWGLDFDDYGEAFITNCVIHHLFHVVPGAHFQRMFGQDMLPHSYSLMNSCADYLHWAGGAWYGSRGGQGEHSKAGGGHAHSGAMIYLGDNWPAEYRNSLFTCNIHGNRLNRDRLELSGSGYAARRADDFMFANDPWFRGLWVRQGPEGAAYVADWCDTGECHNYEVADQTNGRIYRVAYGKPEHAPINLAKLSDVQLAELQSHANDWHVRQSRRLLQERHAAGRLDKNARVPLLAQLRNGQATVPQRLRALWALHVTGGVGDSVIHELLASPEDHLRAWAVRLLADDGPLSPLQLSWLNERAQADESPRVRLALAGIMQRLPLDQRWALAAGLLQHGEDAQDQNLPLMLWYATEPLVVSHTGRAIALLEQTKIPLVREFIARRIASLEQLEPLVALLGRIEQDDIRRDVLLGLRTAIQGQRSVPMPAGWAETFASRLNTSEDAEVRDTATAIALIFGDKAAYDGLRKSVLDANSEGTVRRKALEALIQQHDPELPPLLQQLINDETLRGPAVRGLAGYDDVKTPGLLLAAFAGYDAPLREDAVLTLASRPAYAQALLDAVESGAVARNEITPFIARQLVGMKNPAIEDRLRQVWGQVQATSGEKSAIIAGHKEKLTEESLASADRSHGRAVFGRTCAACHRLFDDGRKVGPDLTGSQRTNVTYILENLVDPNALVGRDYQMTIIVTNDGRTLNGIITNED
ncbi:MAG: PVC-type heme-binding CxxCH protein, partial [Pirellulales bacterium]